MALDKRQSQTDILQLLRGRVEMTRADIAAELGLSMPTVINNVNLMVQKGILEECGSEQSTGGRRARRIRLKTDAAYAVGINVAVHHVSMALTDLQGEILENVREEMIFSDTLDWYRELGSRLRNFVDRCGIPGDKILGVGISFPGIIDEDGNEVIRSHIFGLSHMSTDRFRRFIPWPLTIANDANCGCRSELAPGRDSYLYVSLSTSVGGSIMVNGRIFIGDTRQAGEIGHMILVPGGRRCYCGKKGCADPYLSSMLLRNTLQMPELTRKEQMALFFEKLEAGDPDCGRVWDTYLNDLAVLLTNLRMALDMDMIIGGEVGRFMEPHLEELTNKMTGYDLFQRDIDYVLACRPRNAFTAGAANLALDAFIGTLLEQT